MADMTNMTVEQLQAEIARLQAENTRLNMPRALTCKVSEKTGALSVYGLGRFPVTLYKGQWERLIGEVGKIQAFIAAHPELKVKGE